MNETQDRQSLWRELLLIAFGFALATAAQWFWQYRTEQRDLESAAIGLREVARHEVASCEGTKALLTNAAAGGLPQDWRIYPKGFDIAHESSLFLEIRPRCLRMTPQVVRALVQYSTALNQAQFMRDINREILELAGGDIHDKKTSAWQGYVLALDVLINNGTNLINALDKQYQPQQGSRG